MAEPRILLAFEPPIGGVPQFVRTLAVQLSERGVPVTVAGPPRALPEGDGECLRVVAWEPSHAPAPGDLAKARQLARICRDQECQVIHSHSSKAGVLGGLAARMVGAPSVYSPHAWAFSARGRPAARFFYTSVERTMARLAHDLVIVMGTEELEVARAARVHPRNGFELIHTGIPDAQVPAREKARSLLGLRQDERVVAWIGRAARQKRPQDLAPLQTQLSAHGVRLLALGHGLIGSPEGIAATQAGALILERADPELVLAGADAFIQTSEWEGFPLATLEALRAGLPVFAYRAGGLLDQLGSDCTGVTVPPGDIRRLVAEVVQAVTDESVLRRMATASRRRVSEQFRVDLMVEKYLAAYRRAFAL